MFFSTIHWFRLINFPERELVLCAQSRGCEANEDVSERNGPLFGNSLLCSAGNARRLSIISAGRLLCCGGREAADKRTSKTTLRALAFNFN